MNKYKNLIFQITLTGLLSAVGVIIGFFIHFPLFHGTVYLVGVVIFIMPLILKWQFSIVGCLITIFLTDFLSGWLVYTWISLIAYSSSIIIISFFEKKNSYLLYILGVFIGILLNLFIYVILEYVVIDKAAAIGDLIATSIQHSIVFSIVIFLYPLIKKIKQNLF